MTSMTSTIRQRMRRWSGRTVWAALWLFLAACLLCPIQVRETRLGVLLALAALWIGTLILFRRRRWVWPLCLAVALLVGLALLPPGRPADPAALRADYVRSLRSYAGTPYLWGGESRLGIDCSGLVRRGLIDADLTQGLWAANPHLLRDGLSVWWHDCSAQELGQGYGGRTRPVCDVPSLNAADYARLQPGDVAVTEGGQHTLAYLGDRTWIEADPNARVGDRVIQVHVPDAENAWFDMPMRIVRWRALEG